MAKLYLAALLAVSAAPVHGQSPAPPEPIQVSPDSAAERKMLQKLSACLAKARPRWARNTLAQPYLSDDQARLAAQALTGRDKCIRGNDKAEVTMRTSGMVGSLAEHFLRADIETADPARVAGSLSSLKPLNASEDFALCVSARDPAAARELALSEPGSDSEDRAARRLAQFVEPCTNPGEKLTVELQSLRALVSTALYRGVADALASN
ncbi:MAG TPA: hypothetical protein VFR28_10270 [Allosphingosinicella sp.]|jgi:hypothetical protein|nr:hypothetical protein [Allosphingosinicella sp.]